MMHLAVKLEASQEPFRDKLLLLLFTLGPWKKAGCAAAKNNYFMSKSEHFVLPSTIKALAQTIRATKCPAYLSCHYKTRCCRVDGDIPSHQANILKFFIHLTVLLITQSFNRTSKYYTLFFPQSQGNCIPRREV